MERGGCLGHEVRGGMRVSARSAAVHGHGTALRARRTCGERVRYGGESHYPARAAGKISRPRCRGERTASVHEMSIVSGILESVTEVARRAGASRLCQVNLRIGVMREVVPEAMDLAWEVLCEEDPLTDGCKLTVEDVYPESVCNACGERFTHDRFHLRCPVCRSADTRLIHGRELDIISIEVEHPDEPSQP